LAWRHSVHWTDSELIPVVFTAERFRNGLQAWADELAPMLGAWTLALTLLSFRGPRPLPISRRPGLAALWGASIGLLVHILNVHALVLMTLSSRHFCVVSFGSCHIKHGDRAALPTLYRSMTIVK
jgi:hypothetical protein